MGLAALLLILCAAKVRTRRAVARAFSRAFLRATRVRLSVHGLEHLPAVPCVVIANHASYVDALIVAAALPPDFAFVIKKEMVRVPLASLLLRRLGSEFVERFDRHKGGIDARRVLKRAATGQSLVFFPEGTFDERVRIGRFHAGAFATAARSSMPVVVAAIRGSRAVLPGGGRSMYPGPVEVEILAVMDAADARARSRELIARAVGEPLAP